MLPILAWDMIEPKESWTMFVQPLCSQKLAVFGLGIFLRVSLAFTIENIPHANKKGKANSRVALGSLERNLKLSGMRLVRS